MAFVAPAGHHYHYVDGSGQQQQQQQQHQQHHHHYSVNAAPSMPPQMSCDIKPRLTKEQHDILESHFQKQSKPSTNTKKGFAETLNVSLDKVNNWFQNRRAKSKQDAKKQAGAYNLFAQQQHQQHQQHQLTIYSSDSDTSPSFAPTDYLGMMHPCISEDQIPSTMAFEQQQQQQQQPFSGHLQQTTTNNASYASNASLSEQFSNALMPPPQQQQHLSQDMFDSPQEMNRRTLTQEQFDAALANPGNMMQQLHQPSGLSHANMLQQVFPEMSDDDFKDGVRFSFSDPVGAPLSSSDSSIPSTISEQSLFPSSSAMQESAPFSATSSDWDESRSSSASIGPTSESESPYHVGPAQSSDSGQWQPGQSIPVDPAELHQQFQEIHRQTQQQRQQQHQQHQQSAEQSLAWPGDEVFIRRDSQSGTMLAQQMSSFAIQTPQPSQNAAFKSPSPVPGSGGSIAARRQRPRPAALGLASLRSQSYGGAAQPASASQQTQNLAPAQQLRRIRSSNVINGVASGRVMKSTPGSAQRSPMNFTFAEAMQANQRHASIASSGSLAPPTPLSPTARQDQNRPQFPPWQSSGNFSRQASISESDIEHHVGNMGTAGQPQSFTSPPHTPMYHHYHQQMAPRVGSTVITENTPPQSAPAVQTTFPATAFMPPPPQPVPLQPPPQAVQHQQSQTNFQSTHGQQLVSMSMPEQQFQVPSHTYAPTQQYSMAAPESSLAMSFPNGVPVVNAQGQLTMAFPPQMQQLQFMSHSPGLPPQPQQQYSFVTNGTTPGIHVTSQLPKQPQPPAEFFVHEYSPPSDVKGTSIPRKTAPDNGPKNYTFANQGPEHFERDKMKRGEAKTGTASSSPASVSS